jgi:chromosome segregation ATPase
MPEPRAHVTSVDALEDFRTSLILYVSKARPTVEEVSAEVLRTKLWLENEKRMYWESQVRRRAQALEQAEQALSSARMSNLRDARSTEQMAVRKAKQALEEAEAKLKVLKYWNREFDSRVEPLVKQLEKLHTFLANDLLQANAYLTQAITTLAAYAEMAPPSAATAPSPPADQPTIQEEAKQSR